MAGCQNQNIPPIIYKGKEEYVIIKKITLQGEP